MMRRAVILILALCCGWDVVQAKVQRSLNESFSDPVVRDLAQAACAGDAGGVAAALKKGASANAPGPWNDTPLTWAVSCGNLGGVEILLTAGANPSFKAPEKALTQQDAEKLGIWPPEPRPIYGFSAVYVAAGMDNTDILSVLLHKGGDPNSYEGDAADRSALQRALSLGVHQRKWANYDLLLSAGANIEQANSVGATIADWAVALGAMDKVEELLHRGYKYDLSRLLRSVEIRMVFDPNQVAAKARVIDLLRAKGVVAR